MPAKKPHHKEINPKTSREYLVNSLTGLAEGFAKGIGGLLGFAADLERQGKSEYEECGNIEGKTLSGKKYKGVYGFRVKVGLSPEDFSSRGGPASGWKRQK
jgi:arabinogalactan endo-1,4-beta-galactosidase